jgi:hypothetical protein
MANVDTKKSGSQGHTNKLLSGEEHDLSGQEHDLLTQFLANVGKKKEPSTFDLSAREDVILGQLIILVGNLQQVHR